MASLKKAGLTALLALSSPSGVVSQDGLVISKNPPQCVDLICNGIFHIVRGTTEIVETTVYCAHSFGWFGQTIYANKLIYPFHNGRTCAAGVFKILAEYSEATTDFFNADTVCPVTGTNPRVQQSGCGQVITAVMEKGFDALEALVGTASTCAPPGTDPPYYANGDIPISGFLCWERIWRVIERALVAGKNLDVAIQVCPGAAEERYNNTVKAREEKVENIARKEAGLPPLPPTFGKVPKEQAFKDLAGNAEWRGNHRAAEHYWEAANRTAAQRAATPPPALVRAVNFSVPPVRPTTKRPTVPPRPSEKAPLPVAPHPPAPRPTLPHDGASLSRPARESALSAAWAGLQHPLAPFEAAVGNIGSTSGWSSPASRAAAPAERRRLGLDASIDGESSEAPNKVEHLLARLEAIKDGWQDAMKLYEGSNLLVEESSPRQLKQEEVLSGTSSLPTLQI